LHEDRDSDIDVGSFSFALGSAGADDRDSPSIDVFGLIGIVFRLIPFAFLVILVFLFLNHIFKEHDKISPRPTESQTAAAHSAAELQGIQNNESNYTRDIGIVALILGLAGYLIPIWNGQSIVGIANLCNSPLGLIAQGLGRSDVVSTCGQYTMLANLIYAVILIGVVMILYSAFKK
jgi:hypothetical protein